MSKNDKQIDVGQSIAENSNSGSGTEHSVSLALTQQHLDWATRTGINIESFKKASYGLGLVEFERPLRPRHLHMIAIGGSIGAGFFVGSGGALHNGGAASLLIGFSVMGIMMFNVGKSPSRLPFPFSF